MSASHPDRRTTLDRRAMERRRPTDLPADGVLASATGQIAHLLSAQPGRPRDPIEKLAIAVEALTARLAENASRSNSGPTCTVDEAAILLGTTAKGIYSLYERGKLPRSIGPGRRLVFLRGELLQFARRASPSGGHGR